MTPERVETIDNDTMYTATVTFRSLGESNQVVPHFEYSHQFPDDYVGEYPAAFLCVRDLAFSLARRTQMFASNEAHPAMDFDEEDVPEEDTADAIAAYANRKTLH
jgi:hypothetical protein